MHPRGTLRCLQCSLRAKENQPSVLLIRSQSTWQGTERGLSGFGNLGSCGAREGEIKKIEELVKPGLLGTASPSNYVVMLNALHDAIGREKKREEKREEKDNDRKDDILSVFTIYFRSSIECEEGAFDTEVLPEIKLRSQMGYWKQTSDLCYDESTIHTKHLLDKDFCKFLDERKYKTQKSSLEREEDSGDPSQVLEKYFSEWTGIIPDPLVVLILSLLGDDEGIMELAAKKLEPVRSVENVRSELQLHYESDLLATVSEKEEEQADQFRNKQFSVSISEEKNFTVTNLLQDAISVEPRQKNDLKDLHAENSPQQPWQSDDNRYHLILRPVTPEDVDREKILKLLKKSILKILREVYMQYSIDKACSDDGGTGAEKLFEDLSEESQIHLGNAEAMALQKCLPILSQLNLPHDSFIKIFAKELDNALKKRTLDRKSRKESVKKNANSTFITTEENIMMELKEKLQSLDGPASPEELNILDALRNRVEVECQYNIGSIPFEIFQNANDSFLQLRKDSRKELRRFTLKLDGQRILFTHWGRPINSIGETDKSENQAKQLGYGDDVEKMLFLSNSDKTNEKGITGKFGLGFKSIYLIGDIPRIISENLAFEIRAGFYPKRLGSEHRERLEPEATSDGRKLGTVIEIEAGSDELDTYKAFSNFIELSEYLPFFSKGVDTVEINNEGQSEILRIDCLDKEGNGLIFRTSKSKVLVRLPLGDEGEILIPTEKNTGFSSFEEETPTYWVTVPTDEKLNTGFIVNGSTNWISAVPPYTETWTRIMI